MAGIVPKDVLEDIRNANDITDVIGAYITVKRRGARSLALCPFHKEKTPSFNINSDWQTYHCFGCGASGDVFRFLMEHEGMDFMGAVRHLAHRAGIPLRLEEGQARGDGPDRETLYKILQAVAEGYHEVLKAKPMGAIARTYLEERQMDPELVDKFMLGFAPRIRQGILRWGKREGHTAKQLEQAGLISLPDDETSEDAYYDRFRDRLMFPVWDEQSRVIGFSGRILDSSKKIAKYVNSPETALFKKSRILYALHFARRHIANSNCAVLCEGQIDVIRCHGSGIENAVAAQGTAFTEDHARILKRYADKTIVIFDADGAGQKAAVKTGKTLLEVGMEVRIARLQEGEDPDSFLRAHGGDALRKVLDDAEPLLDFQLAYLKHTEDTSSEAGMMSITKQLLETVSLTPNAVQRALLLERAAQGLGVPVTALQSEFHHQARRATPRRTSPERAPITRQAPTDTDQPSPEEYSLARHMLFAAEVPTVAAIVEEHLPMDHLQHAACRSFVECALEAARSGQSLQGIIAAREEQPGELVAFAARVQSEPMSSLGREFSREEAVQDLVLACWRRQRKTMRESLRPEDPEQRQITHDLQLLKSWDTGLPVIEALMHE